MGRGKSTEGEEGRGWGRMGREVRRKDRVGRGVRWGGIGMGKDWMGRGS